MEFLDPFLKSLQHSFPAKPFHIWTGLHTFRMATGNGGIILLAIANNVYHPLIQTTEQLNSLGVIAFHWLSPHTSANNNQQQGCDTRYKSSIINYPIHIAFNRKSTLYHMPINPMQPFDPCDEDRWFFGFMSRSDATELLSANEAGSFIVRESITSKGDLSLSVKERDDKVSHYIIKRISSNEKNSQIHFKIGDQIFYDVPTLLTFYTTNYLDNTYLRMPAVTGDTVVPKRSFTRDYLAEVHSQENKRSTLTEGKNAAPNMQRHLPCLAKVIQSKIPNAYDKTALTLRKGDLVKVTKMDVSGCWEGEVAGQRGHFPFNYVKFIEDQCE